MFICMAVLFQISYADMLRRVEPLRNELDSVEREINYNKSKVIHPIFYILVLAITLQNCCILIASCVMIKRRAD